MRIIMYSFCVLFSFLCLFPGCKRDHPQNDGVEEDSGSLAFDSSDDQLKNIFYWAKNQALAYAFSSEQIGPWYEAALPGREAFCMRDVSHQAMGAHYLGLDRHTKNMLYLFSKNISESKDWCSLWEINRYGQAPAVDYLNDAEFWYNLPANFDVLDCCYRMYLLTGDEAYLNDQVFLNFYNRTVYDYVDRWDLGMDKIMDRKRIMNSGSTPANSRFALSRGIPGYDESEPGYTAGLDLLATEQAAFEAYAGIQQLRGDNEEAEEFREKAREAADFINTVWWDNTANQYFSYLNEAHELVNAGYDRSVLYWRTGEDATKLRGQIRAMIENLPDGPVQGIEGQSHLPEILYYCEQPELARAQLRFISENERREYPEASFAVVGAMVEGLMGIGTNAFAPSGAIQNGGHVDHMIATKPRLTDETQWAEMKHVAIRGNAVSVRHEGVTRTAFTNNSGPALIWKACFPGAYDQLELNGKPVKATIEDLPVNGKKVSWIAVTVGAGETMTVNVPLNQLK